GPRRWQHVPTARHCTKEKQSSGAEAGETATRLVLSGERCRQASLTQMRSGARARARGLRKQRYHRVILPRLSCEARPYSKTARAMRRATAKASLMHRQCALPNLGTERTRTANLTRPMRVKMQLACAQQGYGLAAFPARAGKQTGMAIR